ncbi:ABC transporter substrate-binding protein [Oceanisphaera avium]|uniref:ABC transporter substrate-binding protein n=2 Tax=Oceanisphaera avium TaxID=1903694 RepID=A0A1Y0D0I8_9GAMM|nr:ABC transporter substrate-binding protein [Oceanisphaera avium]
MFTLAAALCLSAVPLTASAAQTLTDLRGRTVEVPDQINSIAIDDSRFLLALSLLDKNPISHLAAWPKDINRLGDAYYQGLAKAFPAIDDLPLVSSSAESFDMESMLAAEPDVAVVSLSRGPTDAQVALLEASGIPVIFIDFFIDPFKHQAPSLELLAKLTGNEQQATDYLALREQHLAEISTRLAEHKNETSPTVFMEAHAGISQDCCFSPGTGGVGDYIEFVGGHNIGADVLAKASGKLNLEYIIASDPQLYIATGGPALEKNGGLVLGAGYSEAVAQAALTKVASRHGIADLSAVNQGRVHGLAHQLLNSPLDIVAVEVMAKWVHPELFADLDPAQTLQTINDDFLAVPYLGTNWIDLP